MKTVVVVEDSRLLRRVLAGWLEPRFSVHLADNAHLALELVDRHRADYLLLNPLLAGNSGWELLCEISAWPDLRALKIILLTHEAEFCRAYRPSLRELNVRSVLAWRSLTLVRLNRCLAT